MAVLILSKPMPPEPFAAELAARHFGHAVHTSIDAVDPAAVRWLIAWRLPEGLLPTLPNLELLFCCAAGVDKLVSVRDLPPTLPVSRVVDDSQALELAQYVVHAVLDHLRGAPRYRAQQAARQWTRHRALTVGRRALVLGMGGIGRRIALSLGALGFEVTGWTRSAHPVEGIATVHGEAGLRTALPRAEVLVCALPLTAQTAGIVNHATLSALPRGAFFVNIARGAHVVESDLVALLHSGHVGGAALDVQVHEPMPPEDPLWDAPNVTITPHVAGHLQPGAVIGQFIAELERQAAGLPLRHPVSHARGY
jgi:glyoxylate/hydroxypyruvate reductase A